MVSFIFVGVPKVGSYRSEKENVDEDILSLGTGETFYQRVLSCFVIATLWGSDHVFKLICLYCAYSRIMLK